MREAAPRRRWLASPRTAAVLLVVVATVFHMAPLVTGAVGGRPRHMAGAVETRHWPDLAFLCDSLGHLEIASWNPYEGAGYPFHGEATSGAYDPVRWAMCAASGFGSPPYLLAELRAILGLVLAGLFGLLWLRGQGLGWGPATLGAVAIGAAPALRHDHDWQDTAAVAYLPLALWAADRAVERHRIRDAALLGLSLALVGWSGSIWALGAAASFAALYSVVRLIENVRREGREELAPGLSALGLAGFLSAGLLGPAVLPELATRVFGLGEEHPLASLVGARTTLVLEEAVPRFVEDPFYPGLLVFLLAPLALVGRRHWNETGGPPRLAARWLLAPVALVAALLALGPLVPGLASTLGPLLGPWPWPAHVGEIWIGPALGGLAAAGLSWLGEAGPSGWLARHRLVTLGVGLALLLGSFVWLNLGLGFAGCFSLGALALVALASTLPRLGPAHLVVAAACSVLLLVDAFQAAPADRGTEPGWAPEWIAGEAETLVRATGPSGQFRYADLRPEAAGSGSRNRLRDLMAAESRGGSDLGRRLDEILPDAPRLLEQLNVRAVVASTSGGSSLLPSAALAAVRDATPGAEAEGGLVVLPSPAPRAYLVPVRHVERAEDARAALARAGERAPSPVAVLDGASLGPDLGIAPDLAVEHEESPEGAAFVEPSGLTLLRDRLLARLETTEPALLVVNEAWAPGWRAWVGGTEVPVYRVNGVVRGVFVGDGQIEVSMVYSPALTVGLRWVALVALLFCLVALSAALRDRLRSRAGRR